ncbi:DUF6001 family protein [Streptomyces sp. NPDC006393]|uniref:DUF6001 family protein n=1 Tax=Streptomyces sp. NPDC006393 TaxID=3156763 RepID=UPI0033CC8C89
MATPTAAPPLARPEDLTARRHRHVTAFLAERGLNPAALAATLEERVGPGLLLLTSSPVHGLANPTSDLDFIRVQEAPLDGPRIATKIFDHGEHLEIISFSRAELDDALATLDTLAAAPPADTVAAFRAWDRHREPRRKQTERIVNGLTLDGTSPFLDQLPALSTVWGRASLHLALEQAAHTALAEAAGERRGRVGYAYNTLLHLMDALLCHHGDVYTTRKWYLLRWRRALAEGRMGTGRAGEAAAGLEHLRRHIAQALDPRHAHRPLAPAHIELAEATARATGCAHHIAVRLEPARGALPQPFLPGAPLLLAPAGGALPLPDAGDLFDPTPLALADLPRLAPQHARTLLRALRTKAARLTFDYLPHPE